MEHRSRSSYRRMLTGLMVVAAFGATTVVAGHAQRSATRLALPSAASAASASSPPRGIVDLVTAVVKPSDAPEASDPIAAEDPNHTDSTASTREIEIIPRQPGAYQSFDVHISSGWATSCVPYFSHSLVIGSRLELYFRLPDACDGMFCNQVLSDWDATVRGQTLPAGSYQVVAMVGCPGDWNAELSTSVTIGGSGGGAVELIVDDEDGWEPYPTFVECFDPNCPGVGFYRGGPSAGWQTSASTSNIVYRTRATYTYGGTGGFSYTHNNWARWVPFIEVPGRYEVLVHLPRAATGRTDTRAARYTIGSQDGTSARVLSQQGPYGWTSLGTYNFGETGTYVELRDIVSDGASQPTVLYDAVKWVPSTSGGGGGTPGGQTAVDAFLVGLPEGATVQLGQQVDFGYSVRPPGTRIRLTYCDPTDCDVLADRVDDGRGGRFTTVPRVSPGARTITIEAIVNGQVVARDQAGFVVAGSAPTVPVPPTSVPPTSPPMPTNQPTTEPTPKPTPKGVVLYIHGYQGLGGARQHECIETPKALGWDTSFGWLSEALVTSGFLVYVAEWRTGPDYTSTVSDAASCLGKQINSLLASPQVQSAGTPKITLLAHSMGGLVARRYMESALLRSQGNVIDRLITLGSPHRGIRSEDIARAHKVLRPIKWGLKSLEEMCRESPGICDLRDGFWTDYNRLFATNESVRYHAVAGSVNIPLLSQYIPGDDDGVVPVVSAEGVPAGPARVARYRVAAAHMDFPIVGFTADIRSYMDDVNTVCTVMDVLDKPLPECDMLAANTRDVNVLGAEPSANVDERPVSSSAPAEVASVQRLMGDEEIVYLPDIASEIPAGGRTTIDLPLDGYAAHVALRWSGGVITTTLTSPSGTTYSEAELPVQLRGASVERQSLEDGGLLVIEMDEFESGTWQLHMTETVGSPSLVLGFASVRSAIRLETAIPGTVSPQNRYGPLDVSIIARLAQGATVIRGADVVAEARGARITLSQQADGRYAGQMRVTDDGGQWLSIAVTATGETTSGAAFSRSSESLVVIADGSVRLVGQPSLEGRDTNDNGHFEALVADLDLSCNLSKVHVTGVLRAPDGTVITSVMESAPIRGELCHVTLSFAAEDIIRHGAGGPYRLDVTVIDDDSLAPLLGVPQAATSPAYSLSQFDRPASWPTPLPASHAVYLPSLHFGAPAKIDIEFGDGVDAEGNLLNPGSRFGDAPQLCAREDWYEAAGRTLRVRWYSRQQGVFRPLKSDDAQLNPDVKVLQGRGASVQCLQFTDTAGEPISVPPNTYKVEVSVDNDAGRTVQAVAEVTGGPACGAIGAGVRMDCISVAPDRIDLLNEGAFFSSALPVMQAVAADGRSVVAWSDKVGRVHVTPIDIAGRREGTDTLIPGTEVRGLVADGDSFAAIVRNGITASLVRAKRNGSDLTSQLLMGTAPTSTVGSKWMDSIHEGRLAVDRDRLAVYLGHTQRHNDGVGHQGALLWLFDRNGQRQEGGWDWGCSHSLDVRLVSNGRRLGAVCLADTFPRGIQFDSIDLADTQSALIRDEPKAFANQDDVTLGGLVPTDDGFMLSFTSPEGRSSSDVALVHIGDDATVGAPIWLTDTPNSHEIAPHMARTRSGLLTAWRVGSTYFLRPLDTQGRPLAAARAIEAPFADSDDFVTYPNGDVGWAYAWGDRSVLRLVRITP